MAIKEKAPILPVFIDGTRNVIRKRSLVINPNASCRLFVPAPVATEDLGHEDLTKLKDAVFSRFNDITSPAGTDRDERALCGG